MALRDITEDSVQLACKAFDAIGLQEMLEKYGGGPSKKWYIRVAQQLYDQKLILRAAHELQGLGPLPPGPGTFDAHQARDHLVDLGFTVAAVRDHL